MEIITVEMSWFYHSHAQRSNFIPTEYVTTFLNGVTYTYVTLVQATQTSETSELTQYMVLEQHHGRFM